MEICKCINGMLLQDVLVHIWESKFPYIANEVNKRLNGSTTPSLPEVSGTYTVQKGDTLSGSHVNMELHIRNWQNSTESKTQVKSMLDRF